MKKRIILMIACLMSLPLFADGKKPPAAAGAADPASEARVQAESNLMTQGGAAYAESAAVAFAKQSAARMKACRDSTKDAAPFAVYLMLSRRGHVKTSLTVPAGSLAGACLLPSAKADSFPEPPGPNWWIRAGSVPEKE